MVFSNIDSIINLSHFEIIFFNGLGRYYLILPLTYKSGWIVGLKID